MIYERILEKILHNDPRTLLGWFLATCALAAVVSPLLVSLALDLLTKTRRAQTRIRRELNAALREKYNAACAEIVELRNDNNHLSRENIRLTGLVAEEENHNRDWDRRARRAVGERVES